MTAEPEPRGSIVAGHIRAQHDHFLVGFRGGIVFRHDSLARQLGVLGTQLLFFLGALGLIVMVSQKLPTLAAPVAILAALLLATALISIRAPWREA